MKTYQIKLMVKSAIYLVLFAGLIFFAILPSFNEYNQNKIELADQTQKLETAQNNFETLIKLRKDDSTREDIKKNVMTYLPDDKSTSDFVVKIESLSQELGISIPTLATTEPKASVKATPADEDDKSGTTPKTATATKTTTSGNSVEFTLNFNNSYEKIQEYIAKMNSLLRLNSLESISISNYNTENGMIDFRTNGKIYYGK